MSEPAELFIYEYGGQQIYADPFKIRRILLEHTDGRAWEYMHALYDLKQAEKELRVQEEQVQPGTPDGERVKAQLALNLISSSKLEGVLAGATMEAFEFSPIDPESGQGITEDSALEILAKYMEFAEGKG